VDAIVRDLRALGPGRAKIDQIKPGNMEVHWPEGNCLLLREEFDIASLGSRIRTRS